MSTAPLRILVPWRAPELDEGARRLLADRRVAAVLLGGAAVEDATALRALSAAIHSAGEHSAGKHSAVERRAREHSAVEDSTGGSGPTLPPLVVLDPHSDPHSDTAGLRPPDPRHLALDLAAGGEDFEITLKVLTWARAVADAGVDLVLSPRLDRSVEPLDDPRLAARLAGSWTEALLAAGLVACAGPVADDDPDDDDGWAPFGAALAHGLESVFLAEGAAGAASADGLRRRADELVVVGPPARSVEDALRYARAGVDLVWLDASLAAAEIQAVLDADASGATDVSGAESEGASSPTSRVDALREDWLV